MTRDGRTKLLDLLDSERQTIVFPGVVRVSASGVVRDTSIDGKSSEVVYSSSAEDELDQLIAQEVQAARDAQYELEWKVYGHDNPPCLGDRLAAAGFDAGERESYMVFDATAKSLDPFGPANAEIERLTGARGLADYQMVCEEVRGRSCAGETKQFEFLLQNYPDNMSVYVAYVQGEPAACGRIYFHRSSQFGALYGGQTRVAFRNRGLFTQIVASRIRDAVRRGINLICVDALPTSEPILRKLGFEALTYTQPYLFSL